MHDIQGRHIRSAYQDEVKEENRKEDCPRSQSQGPWRKQTTTFLKGKVRLTISAHSPGTKAHNFCSIADAYVSPANRIPLCLPHVTLFSKLKVTGNKVMLKRKRHRQVCLRLLLVSPLSFKWLDTYPFYWHLSCQTMERGCVLHREWAWNKMQCMGRKAQGSFTCKEWRGSLATELPKEHTAQSVHLFSILQFISCGVEDTEYSWDILFPLEA